MTIDDLYRLCDNLSRHTLFRIYKTGFRTKHEKLLDQGSYEEIYTRWSDFQVKGFLLDGDSICEIFI